MKPIIQAAIEQLNRRAITCARAALTARPNSTTQLYWAMERAKALYAIRKIETRHMDTEQALAFTGGQS